MLIVMKTDHKSADVEAVSQRVKKLGYVPHLIPGEQALAIGITGNANAIDPSQFSDISGIKETIRVTKPYKLASRDFKKTDTVIPVGSTSIGGSDFTLIAGPCAVESEDQLLRIARAVKLAGATILRGGAYKPRTSPYSFQGLGVEGLQMLSRARQETGLPFITEAVDSESLEHVAEYADIIQIGARNMQNFSLLKQAGKLRKPVLIKRGPSSTIEELLLAAEYILAGGNSQLILCERGIKSFDPHTRNMLDISAVISIKLGSHLPVIVDPSHGSGRREMIVPLARAAAAVGADGVMIDVHDIPEEALCDGAQAIHPDVFRRLVGTLGAVVQAIS